jgi:hypothetical protein
VTLIGVVVVQAESFEVSPREASIQSSGAK